MTVTTMLIGALILLPAAGLVTWGLFAMARVEEELRSFCRFEALDFAIGTPAARDFERVR